MITKRILGIITAILGVSLILYSFYIKTSVSEGRAKILEAEDTVQRGKQLFYLNPYTKEMGDSLADTAEKKLKEVSAKADRYDLLATWFQIGGGVFIVVGAGLVFTSRKKNKIV